jgi:hypothetical protein
VVQTHSESAKFIAREAQIVQFVFNGITVFGVYKNPSRNKDCSRAIIRYLGKQIVQLGDQPFLITGDMNLSTLSADFDPPLNSVQDPRDMTTKHIWSDFVRTYDLTQHVTEETHKKLNILDYVFAPDCVNVLSLLVDTWAFDPCFDHYAMVFVVDTNFNIDNALRWRRKESWDNFRLLLSRDDILQNTLALDSVNNKANNPTHLLQDCYHQATPEVLIKPPSK